RRQAPARRRAGPAETCQEPQACASGLLPDDPGENSRQRIRGNVRKAGQAGEGRDSRDVLRRRPERWPEMTLHHAPLRPSPEHLGGSLDQPDRVALVPKCKTGPVLPPAPSEVPAGVSRPRSVPNRVLQEQAPTGPDPGWSE